MSLDHIDARACRALWATVLHQALADALHGKPGSLDQRTADAWLRSGPDMPMIAALAGMNGHIVRQRYIAGQIDLSLTTADNWIRRAGREAKRKAA